MKLMINLTTQETTANSFANTQLVEPETFRTTISTERNSEGTVLNQETALCVYWANVVNSEAQLRDEPESQSQNRIKSTRNRLYWWM